MQDAVAALRHGADAVGFIFAESPRKVDKRLVKKICSEVGPWMTTIGVFVNESPRVVRAIAAECGLAGVQLHGEEPVSDLRSLRGLKVIKTFHIGPGFRLNLTDRYAPADGFLFDVRIGGQRGGTGKTFDWKKLRGCSFKRPIIVSGGLSADNVSRAVRTIHPYGVDVSSGVETAPGIKSEALIKAFIKNAKKTI